MKQQTFPSDIIWQKSTCLTASLNSLTITSTMQEVSEGWGQPEKSLFCHAARWLFWMKEASQAYCPYSEMLSWHLDVSIMIILTQLSTLHLRFGGPSEAEDDQHRCCMSSRYTTESPFFLWSPWECVSTARPCYLLELHCSTFLLMRWYSPGPWLDTKSGTWPGSIAKCGRHQRLLPLQLRCTKGNLGFRIYLQIKGILWNPVRVYRNSYLLTEQKWKLKLLRIGFLWAGRKSHWIEVQLPSSGAENSVQ